MHILNIMLAQGKGGIEQAALDYAEALTHAGHMVSNVFVPGGWAASYSASSIEGAGGMTHDSGTDRVGGNINTVHLAHLGEWDPIAAWRLKRICQTLQPDAIICHGNRAIGLALKAARGCIPIIGVAHNYKIKRFHKLDAAFSITQDLCAQLEVTGLQKQRIFHMPNMVRAPEHQPERASFHSPPVIGTMGRFVLKKGFDVFIKALTILDERGIDFRAIIGGDGQENTSLRAMANTLPSSKLTFKGWVADKQVFWDSLDIFVLPSRHEPFGIVLIEAMAQGLPCITTLSEGPSEIITHDHDALGIAIDDATALADSLAHMIAHPHEAGTMGKAAHATVTSRYTLKHMATRLDNALQKITLLA